MLSCGSSEFKGWVDAATYAAAAIHVDVILAAPAAAELFRFPASSDSAKPSPLDARWAKLSYD